MTLRTDDAERVVRKISFSQEENAAIGENLAPGQTHSEFIRRAALEAAGMEVEEVLVHASHDYRTKVGVCGTPGRVSIKSALVTCPVCRTMLEEVLRRNR